jgi:TetR/AcrR family transcriptional repressor of nem operon
MRSTKTKTIETRGRIIAEAAQQFRTHGFAGIGVAELMHGIGLTHGGFYAHFKSKEELMALACRRAVAEMLDVWRARAEAAPDDALDAIIRPYLSREHLVQPATGCLMAALGPEAARQSAPVRQAVTECLEDVLETLGRYVRGPSATERRKQAICIFSSLVGAMVAARAVIDPQLSDAILSTVEDALTGVRS